MNTLLFDNLLSQNVLAWSAQVAILAMAAAAAALALRHSRARLYFWQAILAVALMLPAIVPWKQPVLVALPIASSIVLATNGVPVSDVPAPATWGFEQLLALLAAGAALRLAWVAVGLLRLARIRKLAQPLAHPPVAFGGDARWYVSDQVSGPVTFGWLRPTILLPTKVRDLPASAQEAIASHELFHVHRRDWLFVMAEELIRSVLWFHPAVWFVLSRIQLAREQVVDQEVVHATRDRAGYLDALVSVAAQRLQPDVAPAPLFLKKRQLAVRVQALLKETSMSASRLAAHVSVAAFVAVIGACAAVWFFPLRSAAQVLPDDPGITVDAGATLAHRSPVHNPSGGSVTGDVLLELKLNSKGEVADARVLGGPDELRKAALASVLDWHYAADTAPPSLVHATIHFGQRPAAVAAQFGNPLAGLGIPSPAGPQAPPPPPPPPPPPGVGAGIGGGIGGGRGGGIGAGLGAGPGLRGGIPPPPPPPPPPAIAIVQQIQYEGLSPELQQHVQNGITVRVGDVLDVARLKSELQAIDEHLMMSYSVAGAYDPQRAPVNLRIALRPDGTVPGNGIGSGKGPGVGPGSGGGFGGGAYRIGGGVSAPIPIVKPEPEYSEEARAAKWQGAVLLQLVIDENGIPKDIRIVRSLGMGLDQKAIEAVQQWRFKPGLKDGNPVPVSANIEVNFRLPQSSEPIAGAVTVGEKVMNSRIVSRVSPEYPSVAKLARVQGAVTFNIIVGPDGKVQNVQYVSGPAMLVKEATDAVGQWIYQPLLLNGQPVTVQTTATVNFVLN
jgi:TonB family protein